MLRLFILSINALYSSFVLASSGYQVDLIIFAQPQTAIKTNASNVNLLLLPNPKNAIALISDTSKSSKPYHMLPPSRSSLRDEYYLLNRKHHYQILGHYSWVQPGNNKSTVAIPNITHSGWQLKGTMRIVQTNYYTLDAELQCSPPYNPQSSFSVSQKQRLKGNEVYYLDHAQVGMLVKIHKLT